MPIGWRGARPERGKGGEQRDAPAAAAILTVPICANILRSTRHKTMIALWRWVRLPFGHHDALCCMQQERDSLDLKCAGTILWKCETERRIDDARNSAAGGDA